MRGVAGAGTSRTTRHDKEKPNTANQSIFCCASVRDLLMFPMLANASSSTLRIFLIFQQGLSLYQGYLDHPKPSLKDYTTYDPAFFYISSWII